MKANIFFASLILVCFSTINVFSQLQSFDLSTYKNPFYKRSQLDFSFNLNGGSSWNEATNVSNPFKNTSSTFGGNMNGTFYQILNSEKVQRTRTISLNEIPSFDTDKYLYSANSYMKRKYNQNDLSLNANTSDRYYQDNLSFFEISINANASNNNIYDKSDTYDHPSNTLVSSRTNTFNTTELNGAIGLRYGKGRIENVEDARLAVYILEDLEKHNSLAHSPSNEEILEFAKVITQLKNKRFFDNRIRKIEEMTVVDSFLTANNFIKSHDAKYFTTVNDNWDNAAGPARASGFRYSIGIKPNLTWNNRKEEYSPLGQPDTKNTYKSHIIGSTGNILLEYHKPLNLYWQVYGGLDLGYSFLRIVKPNQSSNIGNIHQLTGDVSGNIGYYPNSRSYFSASLDILYTKANSKLLNAPVGIQQKGSFQSIKPSFTLAGYYYVTQQLRFKVSYSLGYFGSESHDSFDYLGIYLTNYKNFNQNFNITLTYSLF